MPRPTTPAVYEVFGGLNLDSPSELGNFEAKELQNLYLINRGQEMQRRKGKAVLRDFDTIALIDGLEWVRIGGTDYLLSVFDGDVYDSLAGTTVLPGGSNRFPTFADVNGAQLAERLYLGNGTDQNVRWDGSRIEQVMPAQPVSGMTTSVGSGGDMTGTYTYRVTFFSADGIDSQPSEATAPITIGTARVNVANIPTAAATDDSQGRRLWRTLDGGGDYYLIATISDNTTTTYEDNTADADVDLAVSLDLQTVRFPPCKYLVNHQERMIGAWNTTEDAGKRTLFISDYQIPEICRLIAPLDEIDNPIYGMRVPVEDEVTALYSFGNVLLVWTAGQVYRLTGDNPNNWSFDKWMDVGCVSHRAVCSHRNHLIWLGPDGVYMAEGWQSVNRISDPIQSSFEDFSSLDFYGAHAFIWEERYCLCFIDRVFYYDLRFRTWGEITGWDTLNTAVSRNTGSLKERIFSADTLQAKVWELETGASDGGTAIQTRWASKDRDLGHFGREKRIHRVIAAFKTSSGEATVTLYRSGELLDEYTHDLSSVRRTGSEISILEERASEGARDEYFRIEIESSTLADDYRILRAGLHFTLCT
jgi:hypothetical protein